MKLAHSILLIILFYSCSKEKFSKQVIFLEEFNNNYYGWYSDPDTNILYSTSECIKFENGQLKMHFERGLGVSNCGGGWLAMKLDDPNLNREEYFGTIGIKIVLTKGFFQELDFIDSVAGGSTYSHKLQTALFNMKFGKHKLDFPSLVQIDSINLDVNKYEGREFVFLSNTDITQNKVYIDGVEIEYSGYKQWYNAFGNSFDFQMRVEIGYGQELMPHEIDLFIESIEIFTWEGEFCIDKI